MSFFNPLDVITGGAKALPGTGVSQAAINAGKVNAPSAVGQGSLGILGGGMNDESLRKMGIYAPPMGSTPSWTDWPQNTPQPVPGMPPQWFDPNQTSEGPGGFTGHGQDPNYWKLGQAGAGPYVDRGASVDESNRPPLNQPMGSLQSLGGGFPSLDQLGQTAAGLPANDFVNPANVSRIAQQAAGFGAGLNQSGMVNLRGPDGSMKAVPADQADHWLSKGAVRV